MCTVYWQYTQKRGLRTVCQSASSVLLAARAYAQLGHGAGVQQFV